MTVKHEIVWPEIKMPDLYGYATSPFCTLQNVACENKLKIAATALVATYCWILYRIKQTESLLQQHDAWCNWKSAVPIAHLMLTTPQDLLHQLKLDLHKKYALMASSISTCKFANMLINDLQHELQLLDTYTQWHTITKRLWCNKLFFFQHDMTSIAEKKTRILFILDLFMAQYAKE